MYNVDFDKLNKHSKKCLYISNNKAVVRSKELYSFGDILKDNKYDKYCCEVEFRKDYSTNKNIFDYGRLYVDLGVVFYEFVAIYNNTTIQNVKSFIDNNTLDYNMLKNDIDNKLNNNRFINVAEIKLAELMQESQEYINKLVLARENHYKRLEEQEQLKIQEREQKEKERIENINKQIEIKVAEFESKILNQEDIFNEDVETASGNITSIFLLMFKKYNIDIPLKTQGWINKALYCTKKINDKYNYQYYSSSKNSTVFTDYLLQLIIAIKEANNAITPEEHKKEELRQQEIINKNNFIKSIKNIKFEKSNNYFRDEMDWRRETREWNEKEFTKEEAEILIKRMYKALNVDDVEYMTKIYFSLPYSNRKRLNVSKGNIVISLIASEQDGKIQYKFAKQYKNKDDYYFCREIV